MKLVRSTIVEVPTIMKIVGDAQQFLAAQGIDQWQDGYPNEEQISLDIKNKDSYVVLNDVNEIIGTTVFTTKTEPTYKNIAGEWITSENSEYGVIHRLAVSDKYRKLGLAKFVFNECEQKLQDMHVKSMRIDTHKDNKGMQSLLEKRAYTYCGVIILDSGDKRFAYEKLIK